MTDDKPVPLNAPDVRTELVERVRREIQAGTYETPEKLEAALEHLLERLEWAD
jgi:hypothetical protein